MANLLGRGVWQYRSKKCKNLGCCRRPRRTRSSQRLLEERQWEQDWFEETAPEYPEYLDRVFYYVSQRYNVRP